MSVTADLESIFKQVVFKDERFVRELVLVQDIDYLIRNHIRIRNKPSYVWGAGERAKSLLEWTSLKSLNITGVIDSDVTKSGASFDRYIIQHPDQIDFKGQDIIIANATAPYSIEKSIRHKNLNVGAIYVL
jgi:hypothetical protein